ncbi:MAG: PKD domain-containing protein [Bacteroidota bacterium]
MSISGLTRSTITLLVMGMLFFNCEDDDTTQNNSPVASYKLSATILKVDEVITVVDSSYDIDGDPIRGLWYFGDGRTSSDTIIKLSYESEGEYVLSRVVSDGPLTDSTARRLTVIKGSNPTNMLPVISFDLSISNQINDSSFYVGSRLVFENTSTDIDGEIKSIVWNFNNGVSSTDEIISFNAEIRGELLGSLEITDDQGNSVDTTFQFQVVGIDFEDWKEGWLDIHHINTGRGDATFFIFPDGTTMLFDAGDKYAPGNSNPDFPVHPNNSRRPGYWIVDYIKKMTAHFREPAIDYAVISHFHGDHFGKINDRSPRSSFGGYELSGITEVGDLIPINYIVDRGYPTYDFPVDLKSDRESIDNYADFLDYHIENSGLQPLEFQVGSKSQIVQLRNPALGSAFHVQNVYANGQVWTGIENEFRELNFDPPLVNENGDWNGNSLSISLLVNYGSFSYFTGGDIEGEDNWPGYDIESELIEVLSNVDALSLNHHGFPDASNSNFLAALNPQVTLQQASSDSHINGEVLTRIESNTSADVFTSNMRSFFSNSLGLRYASTKGHQLVRVYDNGEKFKVIILNDHSENLSAIKEFGPYQSM